MIVIQDTFGTSLMVNGNDATITQIAHQDFINDLTLLQDKFETPILSLMQGNQPVIQVQIQSRAISQFLAQLAGAPQIPCVQQHSKVASVSAPVFIYVIQPVAQQVTNFQQHTVIWKVRLATNSFKQQS